MNPVERRWATPAAAVLAFCLTLVVLYPPMQPQTQSVLPTPMIADGLAAMAGHAILAVVALFGVGVALRLARHRPTLRTQDVSPTRASHAA
jgi:predicted naringenin-chalcone synthase